MRARKKAGLFAGAWLYLLGSAALLALVIFFFSQQKHPRNPEVNTPVLALTQVHSTNFFFNPAAASFLHREKGETLEFAPAAHDPKLWRKLDRKIHFDAVFLFGEPAEFRPLLQHLLVSSDWVLTYLDHTSFIFERAPRPGWSPSQVAALTARFASSPPDLVEVLVASSRNLREANFLLEARDTIAKARSLNDKNPAVWAELAILSAQEQHWNEALEDADRALKFDKSYAPALSAKAQVLFGTRRFSEAYSVSEQLLRHSPDDAAALFLHAKIAHELHAYSTEIETLRKLIAMADQLHERPTIFRIYLGQAYACIGDRDRSASEFSSALADPDLDAAQRAHIGTMMKRLSSSQ
jgi:hypothetical protein